MNIYKFKLPRTHTQAVARPSTNIHGFGDIKAYLQQRHQSLSSTISPYLMKTNPWFACVVLFEFESTCKTYKMHVPKNNHIQVPLAPMNQFSLCDFHKENQQNQCEKQV